MVLQHFFILIKSPNGQVAASPFLGLTVWFKTGPLSLKRIHQDNDLLLTPTVAIIADPCVASGTCIQVSYGMVQPAYALIRTITHPPGYSANTSCAAPVGRLAAPVSSQQHHGSLSVPGKIGALDASHATLVGDKVWCSKVNIHSILGSQETELSQVWVSVPNAGLLFLTPARQVLS